MAIARRCAAWVGLVLLLSAVSILAPRAAQASGPTAVPPDVLTLHNPITITSNAGFNVTNGVTNGTGTASDPYLIEGWEIDIQTGPGITITGTTAFVILRNDYVHADGANVCGGTILTNVHNVTLDSFTTSTCQPGIGIQSSVDVTVRNSQLSSTNDDSVLVQSSSRITISGNYMWFGNYGVESHNVQGLSVTGNTIGRMGYGVWAVSTPGIVIANNTFSQNLGGLGLQYSNGSLVVGNLVEYSLQVGLVLAGSANVSVTGNNITQNGLTGISADTALRLNLTGNSVSLNPLAGFFLSYCVNLTLVGNIVTSNGVGANLTHSFGALYHNHFTSNTVQSYADIAQPWDNGYPSGGNWWSDYNGPDHCHGPAQDNCTGGDGIGDVPYYAQGNPRDRYPLIPPMRPPLAAFNASATEVFAGDTVTFDGSASTSLDGTIVSYTWSFGDGSTGFGETTSHSYAIGGDFIITLRVTDDRGISASVSASVLVDPLPTMVVVTHSSGYQLLVPNDWTVEKDQTIGGTTVQLLLLGPTSGTFRTNVVVSSETESTVREDHGYLAALADAVINGTLSNTTDQYLDGGLMFATVGGHGSVSFLLRSQTSSVVQRIDLVVSAANERAWILVLTTSSDVYPRMNRTFDLMLSGFAITALPTLTGDLVVLAVGGGIVAAVALVLVLVVRRRNRRSRPAGPFLPAPPTITTVSLTSGFCSSCGSPLPAGYRFCGSCGTPVPATTPAPPTPQDRGGPGAGLPP